MAAIQVVLDLTSRVDHGETAGCVGRLGNEELDAARPLTALIARGAAVVADIIDGGRGAVDGIAIAVKVPGEFGGRLGLTGVTAARSLEPSLLAWIDGVERGDVTWGIFHVRP